MPSAKDIGLDEFLREYPSMAIRPSTAAGLRLKGRFRFSADHPSGGLLTDDFSVEIAVPASFPRDLPVVTETGGRIPRPGEFHVNGDGSLCLGSYLRLLDKISGEPTLCGFASRCLVPYLYAVSLKLKGGGALVFGELPHYGPGMLQDYAQLFSLTTMERAHKALILLTEKKRLANKRPCPCGCKLRLGRCRFRYRLLRFRKLASRGWYRAQLSQVRAT